MLHRIAPRGRLLLCWVAGVSVLSAQPTVTGPATPSSSPSGSLSVLGGFLPANFQSLLTGSNIQPHATVRYGFSMVDGIQSAPGTPSDSDIHTFSLGLDTAIGRRLKFDYMATQSIYSNSAFDNSLSHLVNLTGNFSGEVSDLSVSQSYSSSSQLLVETGSQTPEETFTTSATFGRTLGPRSRLEVSGNQYLRLASFRNSRARDVSRSLSTWLLYAVSSRLNGGPGVTVGMNDSVGSEMTFVQMNGRVSWQLRDKISLQATAGAERRRFKSSDKPAETNPVYGGSLTYRPFSTTQLTASIDRGSSGSYFVSQGTESTSWNVGLQQRLLGRISFSATATEWSSDYFATEAGVADLRDDEGSSFSMGLSTAILRNGSIGVNYRESRNTSTTGDFSFSTRQIGFDISYRF